MQLAVFSIAFDCRIFFAVLLEKGWDIKLFDYQFEIKTEQKEYLAIFMIS